MKVRFASAARAELREAISYYNQRKAGLGREFAREVRKATQRIADFPDAWTPISANARRCLLNRFPFGLIYSIEDDTISIVAVMHLHREPSAWQDRLTE